MIEDQILIKILAKRKGIWGIKVIKVIVALHCYYAHCKLRFQYYSKKIHI